MTDPPRTKQHGSWRMLYIAYIEHILAVSLATGPISRLLTAVGNISFEATQSRRRVVFDSPCNKMNNIYIYIYINIYMDYYCGNILDALDAVETYWMPWILQKDVILQDSDPPEATPS